MKRKRKIMIGMAQQVYAHEYGDHESDGIIQDSSEDEALLNQDTLQPYIDKEKSHPTTGHNSLNATRRSNFGESSKKHPEPLKPFMQK